MNVVEVFFEYNKSSSFFRNNGLKIKNNLTVLVNTDRGIQFGKVINIYNDMSQFEDLDLYDVIRISTKKDYLHYLENNKMSEEALAKCKDAVKNSNLNISIEGTGTVVSQDPPKGSSVDAGTVVKVTLRQTSKDSH